MSPTETIIQKILDLDAQAETIRADARQKAQEMHNKTLQLIEDEKRALDREIAERTARIAGEAGKKRGKDIELVREEYAAKAAAIGNLPVKTIEHGVQAILSLIREQ